MITHIINKKDAAKNNIDMNLVLIKIETDELMDFSLDDEFSLKPLQTNSLKANKKD